MSNVLSFNGKPLTREQVEIAREAAARALTFFSVFERTPAGVAAQYSFLRNHFPMPKVTKPLEVEDSGGYRWRVEEGQLQYSNGCDGWRTTLNMEYPKDRLKVLADLLNDPTVEVEAES